MDLNYLVPRLLLRDPAVKQVVLTDSRARGEATLWSDWDFTVEVTDFNTVASHLPELIRELQPVSCLWDPLYHLSVYMLILPGPVKVDLIFDHPHALEPPWTINQVSLPLVNSHFWDWILWLAGKVVRQLKDLVRKELDKLYLHILAPLGSIRKPDSLEEAVKEFQAAFNTQKTILQTSVSPALEMEVTRALRKMDFRI